MTELRIVIKAPYSGWENTDIGKRTLSVCHALQALMGRGKSVVIELLVHNLSNNNSVNIELIEISPNGKASTLYHDSSIEKFYTFLRTYCDPLNPPKNTLKGKPRESANSMTVETTKTKQTVAARLPKGTAPPTLLFISGAHSQVGKSTFCVTLLSSLLTAGIFKPTEMAYIKPATQCEATQLVAKFCAEKNIAAEPIGPVVFYKGFTRAFLDGTTDSSKDMLQNCRAAIQNLGKNKKFVLIDGVGYPAVGSIVGVSNAHVAKTVNAPVLLIGKSGVGDAIDSYNLGEAFFAHHGVRVLGVVFNRLSQKGYYSIEKVKVPLNAYFDKFAKPERNQRIYGLIPELVMTEEEGEGKIEEENNDSSHNNDTIKMDVEESLRMSKSEKYFLSKMTDLFMKSIDLRSLIDDAQKASTELGDNKNKQSDESQTTTTQPSTINNMVRQEEMSTASKSKVPKRTREEITREAMNEGATGG
eukprot:g2414.t1